VQCALVSIAANHREIVLARSLHLISLWLLNHHLLTSFLIFLYLHLIHLFRQAQISVTKSLAILLQLMHFLLE
jgi:hypothetical protein